MQKLLPVLAGFAISVAPISGAAQAVASAEDCAADLAAVDAIASQLLSNSADIGWPGLMGMLPEGNRPVAEDGYCVIKDVRFPQMSGSQFAPQYTAGLVRWQAEWADPSRPMPPDRLTVDVQGAGMNMAAFGDPEDSSMQMFAYQSALLNKLYPMEFRLDMAFDREADRFEIRQFVAQNSYQSRIELSAAMRDIDLDGILQADMSTAPPLDKLAQIAIERAEITAISNGFFERVAMSWLPAIYPRLGETPETAVAAAQSVGRDQVSQLSDSMVPPDSKAALIAMIDSLPHPIGTLRLVVDAPEGIMPSRIAATQMLVKEPTLASYLGILGSATVTAEWTPLEWPPQMLPPLFGEATFSPAAQ